MKVSGQFHRFWCQLQLECQEAYRHHHCHSRHHQDYLGDRQGHDRVKPLFVQNAFWLQEHQH